MSSAGFDSRCNSEAWRQSALSGTGGQRAREQDPGDESEEDSVAGCWLHRVVCTPGPGGLELHPRFPKDTPVWPGRDGRDDVRAWQGSRPAAQA